MPLTNKQLRAAHTLWDELADFPASQIDGALTHLMNTLAGALAGDDVVWVGAARLEDGPAARRDPQNGWRGVVVEHLHMRPSIRALSRRATVEQDTEPGLTTKALAAGAGRLRVHRLHDGFVDLAAFRRTQHYRAFYEQAGITDRMFIGFPLNADAESFLLIDRYRRNVRFSAADAEFVRYIMRGLKWFHRELMLSHGLLLAAAPLSATERRIAHLLLTSHKESQIAAALDQSPKTTHKYVTEILRKFGVKGRTGLMALWLHRQM
jgi:Response regulator containing a CheY-like receiver domain and an HTH DNA-binding domain|nr:LuxR C-terminal-related transcriptional regulator [uncultured Steroidobacter sp.]